MVTQYYPQPGWVEHDPDEIWKGTIAVIAEALKNGRVSPEEIEAIGIANQAATTVFWNKKTGEPVGRAIVWLDQRSLPICERLIAKDKVGIETRTGMRIAPNASAPKIRWLMENDKSIQKGIARGELLFGTIDSWLIWKLSGGSAHVTDHSNANITLLLNAHTLGYDEWMLNELAIPREILPDCALLAKSTRIRIQSFSLERGYRLQVLVMTRALRPLDKLASTPEWQRIPWGLAPLWF